MARRLTASEKSIVRSQWPRMDVDDVWVSGPATGAYNCLAWTLGIDNRWVWPWGTREPSVSQFNSFFRSRGYVVSSGSGIIAGFGTSSDMLHASITGPGHGTRWESKCGRWLRIQHGLGEMERGAYGIVRVFYRQETALRAEPVVPPVAPEIGKFEAEESLVMLVDEEKKGLSALIERLDANLQQRFQEAYEHWRETWDQPWLACSSNPADYTRSQAFFDLIALGPEIAPLLVHKLQEPDGFFALQALRYVGRDALFAGQDYDLDDPRHLQGEQGKAQEVLQRFIALEC